MFNLNPTSGVPIYRQLTDQIRRMVAGGQLQPGDSLPSVRELAVVHAVNPMTISKAYSLLESEGILVRLRGKPMQVATTALGQSQEPLAVLAEPLEQLVTAARQLELTDAELKRLLDHYLKQGK
ncbi:MAG TPA: GntR family transcriptional regulator [Cellvibrionaceae bacterium]